MQTKKKFNRNNKENKGIENKKRRQVTSEIQYVFQLTHKGQMLENK